MAEANVQAETMRPKDLRRAPLEVILEAVDRLGSFIKERRSRAPTEPDLAILLPKVEAVHWLLADALDNGELGESAGPVDDAFKTLGRQIHEGEPYQSVAETLDRLRRIVVAESMVVVVPFVGNPAVATLADAASAPAEPDAMAQLSRNQASSNADTVKVGRTGVSRGWLAGIACVFGLIALGMIILGARLFRASETVMQTGATASATPAGSASADAGHPPADLQSPDARNDQAIMNAVTQVLVASEDRLDKEMADLRNDVKVQQQYIDLRLDKQAAGPANMDSARAAMAGELQVLSDTVPKIVTQLTDLERRIDAAFGRLDEAKDPGDTRQRAVAPELAAKPKPAVVAVRATKTCSSDLKEANLHLAQRKQIQSRLDSLGFGINHVDGRFGANSRTAIKAWQKRIGAADDGSLTPDQIARLLGPATGCA